MARKPDKDPEVKDLSGGQQPGPGIPQKMSMWLANSFLIGCCMLSLGATAQNDITLPGLVVMQNSKYKTGQREFIPFASVKSSAKCTPTTSDTKGEFTLVFVDKPAGDAATIFVEKSGLEVVNAKDLEEAAIVGRLKPLTIVMCKSGTLEENKELYYLISDSAIQKAYESRLKALAKKQGAEYEAVIASLKKEMKRNIKDAEDAISALNDQLQLQKKQVKDLVNQFVVENLDDQSETYQQAFEAFTNGKIDEAISILDKVDLGQRLEKNSEQIKNIKSAINNLSENIDYKEQQMQQDVQQALLDARMHKLKYQFDEAKTSYALVVKYDSTNFEYIKEYYSFLNSIMEYDEAIKILNTALTINKNMNGYSSFSKWDIVLIHELLGLCYFSKENYSSAEESYNEVLKLEKELVKVNPDFYEPKIAGQKFLLALLYSDKNDCDKSEALFLEALDIYKRLAKVKPEAHEPDVMMTENSLAYLYWNCNNDFQRASLVYKDALIRYKKFGSLDLTVAGLMQTNIGDMYKSKKDFIIADSSYNEALKTYKILAQSNPLEYDHYVADVQVSLGDLNRDKKDYSTAETFYLTALDTYNNLVKSNAQGFLGKVADIKNDLGILYEDEKDYKRAESFYLESLETYKLLVNSNPQKYELDVARMQNNLGLLYKRMKEYVKSESEFLRALEIRAKLAKQDSAIEHDFADTENDLGVLYKTMENYPKCETAYLKSLEIYEKFAAKRPNIYEKDVARMQNNLGELYKSTKRYPESESAFLKALEIKKRLAKQDSSLAYEVAETQNDLGNLYEEMKNYLKAEPTYHKSLETYQSVALKAQDANSADVAMVYSNLGLMYRHKKDFLKAESAQLNAIRIYEQLALINANKYEEKFLNSKLALIRLYGDMLDSVHIDTIMVKYRMQIISTCKRVSNKLPKEGNVLPGTSDICGNLSWHLLIVDSFKQAEKFARLGLQMDTSQIWIKTNLAHSLLLQGRYSEAEKEYLSIKEIKDIDGTLFKDEILKDFADLEKSGITNADIKKIKELLR